MKKKFDITEICNYDGLCMLSDKNSDKYGYAWCYGEKFGCAECPLKDKIITINVKGVKND